MYKIKQIPEDFIVMEKNEFSLDKNSIYSYYLLKKKNYNTVDAVKKISRIFNIRKKFINFAGNKDKAAVTTQYISIKRGQNKDLNLVDIKLKYLGRCNERLNLGSLLGNEFEIVVRNIIKSPKKKNKFVNYFDSQRFGKDKNNHIIGSLILNGKYKNACELIHKTAHYLKFHKNDYVGALRSIPKSILRLYVHAYQSHLWNIAAKVLSEKFKENIKIPIIGFGTEFENKKIENLYTKIMKKEKISLRDFINKKIPELSEEGSSRDLYIIQDNISIEKFKVDELNPKKNKVLVKFFFASWRLCNKYYQTII